MPFHHYNRTEIALTEERISGQIKHEKLMFPAEDILLNNLYFVVYSAIAKRNHASPFSPQNTASFYAASFSRFCPLLCVHNTLHVVLFVSAVLP